MEWVFSIAPQLHEKDFFHDWTKVQPYITQYRHLGMYDESLLRRSEGKRRRSP